MKHLATLIFAIMAVFCARGQVAVKTNLLFDAVTSPNLGMEVGGGRTLLPDVRNGRRGPDVGY